MGITRGNFLGVDMVMILVEDLTIIPLIAGNVGVLMIAIDIKKHSPSDVANMLRGIKARTTIEQCIFLTIDGYDNDPRELFEIPEIKVWASEYVAKHSDTLGFLVDERGCQNPKVTPALYHLADGGIGRAKMCVLAGHGHMESGGREDGGYWLTLDTVGHAILASLVQQHAQA